MRGGSSHRDNGSVNLNVEPAPTWLFTQILPPWSSMNLRERAAGRVALTFAFVGLARRRIGFSSRGGHDRLAADGRLSEGARVGK